MPLNIKDAATERCVRELAAITRETVTTAVTAPQRSGCGASSAGTKKLRNLAEEILQIGQRCAALPDLDRRSADEILGYDENGLPT